MRVKYLITILMGFQLFVNCNGFTTSKKEGDLDKNAENLLLVDYLNKTSELNLLRADYLNKTSIEYLEINGKWKDDWNSYHYIYAEKNPISGLHGFWEGLVNRVIVEFNNNTKTLYVKGINEPSWASCDGDATNGEPGVECYSRIVWTKYNDHYYYCEIVYNKGSLDAAKSDPTTANATNPATSGCGGFSWTKFVQKLD